MSKSSLRPNAPEFVPRSTSHFYYAPADNACYYCDPACEENLTEEDLEELEACEDWVRTMAELDEMEREHLIATALSEADPSQILEVEMRAMAMDTEGDAKRRAETKRKGKH